MASCPKCGQEWLWDWCHDTFRQPDGGDCRIAYHGDVQELYCHCGLWVGRITDGEVESPDEWIDIDWELKEHSYDCYQ